MPARQLRTATGVIFHVMNRGARRHQLFDDPADYRELLGLFEQGRERTGLEILAYCLMPNHFHLLVRQREPDQVSRFMGWALLTHAKRWHRRRSTEGTGAVYQGRYRAIPVQADDHFVAVARYIERNPLRAGLVRCAQDWPWSSLSQRCKNSNVVTLTAWPIPPGPDWIRRMNQEENAIDLAAIRTAVEQGTPLGGQNWSAQLTMPKKALRGRRPRDTVAHSGNLIPGIRFPE